MVWSMSTPFSACDTSAGDCRTHVDGHGRRLLASRQAMHTGAALPRHIRRVDTFKRVAETRPRLANAVGKGRFSLIDFLPGV